MSTNALHTSVSEYLSSVEARFSPATYRLYQNVLEAIFLPWADSQGLTEPGEITDKQMDQFVIYLKRGTKNPRKPLSVTTIRTYLRSVRTYLNWSEVPKGRFLPPKRRNVVREVLSRSEIQAMEDAALDERDRLIIRVLADSGIRVGELLGLKPADLRQDNYTKQTTIKVDGKTGERMVILPAPVWKRLKQYADTNKTSHIFTAKRRNSKGEIEPLTKSGVEQSVRALAKVAKINKRVFPHLFRHSYVTHMAQKGVSPIVVQHQMGHSSLTLISEVYSHIQSSEVYDEITKALK